MDKYGMFINIGDIVFYHDKDDPVMVNLVTEVKDTKTTEKFRKLALILTRRNPKWVDTAKLIRLPVDKAYNIYKVTTYKPAFQSPE